MSDPIPRVLGDETGRGRPKPFGGPLPAASSKPRCLRTRQGAAPLGRQNGQGPLLSSQRASRGRRWGSGPVPSLCWVSGVHRLGNDLKPNALEVVETPVPGFVNFVQTVAFLAQAEFLEHFPDNGSQRFHSQAYLVGKQEIWSTRHDVLRRSAPVGEQPRADRQWFGQRCSQAAQGGESQDRRWRGLCDGGTQQPPVHLQRKGRHSCRHPYRLAVPANRKPLSDPDKASGLQVAGLVPVDICRPPATGSDRRQDRLLLHVCGHWRHLRFDDPYIQAAWMPVNSHIQLFCMIPSHPPYTKTGNGDGR